MTLSLLHHEVENAAGVWGDRVALLSPSARISFSQLNQLSSALAGALQQFGLRRGDRLAILGHNSVDFIAWHYAAARAGIILHVLNIRLAVGELEWMINNAQSAALIADREHSETALALKKSCPSLRMLIGMAGESALELSTDALADQCLACQASGISPSDPALMIYTSGTTGRPKGALQSHAGSLSADQYTRDAVAITQDDTYLALMPFFHQAGLIRTRATILAGGCCVIPGKLDATAAANAISAYKVSFTMIASAEQYAAIEAKLVREGPEQFDTLRVILGGGGLGERRAGEIKALCEALNCNYFGVYGQTETTGPAVYITGEDVFERPEACGKPFPGIDIAIWEERGTPVAPEMTGEIMVRGPITAKYWRNDAANAALYAGEWIHTGDIGYLDSDGFLYIKGRIKELVKTGAENVYPREVEAVLELHPDIVDVAVFGLPDQTWGEIVCAAIVWRDDAAGTLAQIKTFCRGKIGGYKIPKRLLQVETIPRNHTGKIVRQPLIERAMAEGESGSSKN